MNQIKTALLTGLICFFLLLIALCLFGLLVLGFAALQAMLSVPSWIILTFVGLLAVCCGVAGGEDPHPKCPIKRKDDEHGKNL